MNKYHKDLGRFLKFHRKNQALTQWDIAKVLGYESPQFVSNFERGLCCPSLDSLPVLCKLYKIEPKKVIDFMLKAEEEKLKALFNLID